MDLHLEGNVIVLDEGHNVEDTARDSASLAVNLIQLEEVVDEMDKMCMYMCVYYNVCMYMCLCCTYMLYVCCMNVCLYAEMIINFQK